MGTKSMMALISKEYCSISEVVFVVRRRPHAVNGGGFVVSDFRTHRVPFRVDGCGILGAKEELLLRHGFNGDPLLLIRRHGGMLEALSIHRKWKGYKLDYEESKKLVFCLKEPNSSCLAKNNSIRISTKPRTNIRKDSDFEIIGSFPDKHCSIIDSSGNAAAQVKKELESKDVYRVVVEPGIDQAFVFGVIAILDYTFGESTRC